MKKILLFVAVCTFVTSCTTNLDNHMEELSRKNLPQQRLQNAAYSFPLSFDEQNDLFFEFASLFTIQEVRQYFLESGEPYEYSNRWHAILNFQDEENIVDNTELKDILDRYGLENFPSLIEDLCTNNYLNFNIYIPHFSESQNVLCNVNYPIYFVNALYSEALDKIHIDNDENNPSESSFAYSVTYIVEDTGISTTDLHIDENFCSENIVIFVSFRDYIVNWNHFSKGTQSVSDWLLSATLEYQGYGCTSVEELIMENTMLCGKLTFPILHSKKTFQKPCDEKYDHFCKLGKPEELEYNKEFTAFFDFDPYRTSWVQLEEGVFDQYIPIKSNPIGLDLTGHDFPLDETIIESGSRVFYIPKQICTYDSETNSQHFVMYY